MNKTNLNTLTLKIFAPILIVAGVLGFLTPPRLALMSGAAEYNIFHLAFGALGLALAFSGRDRLARYFNIGFGLVDLYQAVASFAGLFPKAIFKWTTADDVLHVVIGLVLVGVGVLANRGGA